MRTLPTRPPSARRSAVERPRRVLVPLLLVLALACAGLLGSLAPAAVLAAHPAAADPAPPRAAAPAAPAQDAAAQDAAPAESLVVIGASGLDFEDIDPEATPHLFAFAEDAALANLSVRSLTSATCPASGWLTLGAGDRAGAVDLPDAAAEAAEPPPLPPGPAGYPAVEDTEPTLAPEASTQPTNYVRVPPRPAAACPEIRTPVPEEVVAEAEAGAETAPEDFAVPEAPLTGGVIPEFDRIESVNAASGYTADLGAMAAAVRDAGGCTQAIGPGAGYAAASPEGVVADWGPGGTPRSDCVLTLIDVGSVGDPGWVPQETALDGAHQLSRVDQRVEQYLEDIDLETTDVVIAGVGDAASPSRLRALMAAGPSYEPGILTSSSTRQEGTAQLTDVPAAALTRVAGLTAPEESADAAWTVDTAAGGFEDRLATVRASAAEAATVHTHAQTFSVLLDVVHYLLFLALAGLLLVTLHARLGAAGSIRLHRALGWTGLVIAVIPMGSFLAGLLPWARFPVPALGLGLAVLAGSLALLAIAVAGPWRRTFAGRVAAVSLTTAVVLAVDIALGSGLQFNSLMGYNPIVAGRFYGLGNQGAALFIVAVFLGLAIVCRRLVIGHRGRAAALVAVVGLASVVTLGNPAWGAKFGGTIATLAGFLVLLALLLGIRLNIWRLVLIGAISLAAILGIAGLDYLRPPSARSHFGTFFGQILDGELFTVIGRKLAANLNIMVINPALALIVPLAIIAVLFFLAYLARFSPTARFTRPWAGRLPALFEDRALHAGFLAVAVGLAVGGAITDSGIAVPATGAMMAVPLLLALSADTVPQRIPEADAGPRGRTGTTVGPATDPAAEQEGLAGVGGAHAPGTAAEASATAPEASPDRAEQRSGSRVRSAAEAAAGSSHASDAGALPESDAGAHPESGAPDPRTPGGRR